MKKVIVIIGPTGVGKTKLSVLLAKKLHGEIINADSMQVYKDLDIGTAKVKENEKEGIKHYLLDICNVSDNYTIYDYQKDARKIIDELLSHDITPILVGGSGLYIKAALYDYKFQKEGFHSEFDDLSNEELKKEIEKYFHTDIHVNNRKRLVRELNKIKNNTVNKSNVNEEIYNIELIGLTTDRDKLYDIINKRVDIMVKNGLVEEVRRLYNQKIRSKAIMTGIGYKELYQYFDHEITLEEAIELIKKNSRNFAKRQYTFFKHQMHINWFNVDFDNFNNTVEEVYQFIINNDC